MLKDNHTVLPLIICELLEFRKHTVAAKRKAKISKKLIEIKNQSGLASSPGASAPNSKKKRTDTMPHPRQSIKVDWPELAVEALAD